MRSEGWPSGIVTFLFSDIVGSTRQWEASPEMRARVDEHFRISADAVAANGGAIFSRMGDGIAAAFASAGAAVAAAVALQLAMPATGLSVRIGLHTGDVDRRDDDYRGRPVNRAARIMAVAHGGQVLVSAATAALLDETWPLRDLGVHQLRDLSTPEHLWQVAHPSIDREFPRLRSLDAFATNLPSQRTRLIGRETELRAVTTSISSRPLVTLVGVGGVGKTRLALQAAAELLDSFEVVHVSELAALDDGSAVADHVAGSLGATVRSTAVQTLVEALSGRRALLVLDNCEHVLDDVADLVDTLVGRCPDLRVLATSREALDVDGEQVIGVSSLDADAAVELFAERMTDAGSPAASAGADVGQLCARLDHLPLAIELAAARARSLGVDAVLAGLDDRFTLLTGGRRRRTERHATMRATIEWSYRLLSDDEQRLFRWLGPHAGFELDAATFVAEQTGLGARRGAPVLASLVDRQMVVADTAATPVRYRMLETLRAFALEALADTGETDQAITAHIDWIGRLSAFSLADDDQAGLPDRFLRLEREPDNWRIAFDAAVDRGDVAAVGRICRGTTWGVLVAARGDLLVGADRALDLGLDTPTLVSVLATLYSRDGGTDRADQAAARRADLDAIDTSTDAELRFVQTIISTGDDAMTGRVEAACDGLLAATHDPALHPGHRAFLVAWGSMFAFGLRLRAVDDPIVAELSDVAHHHPNDMTRALALAALAWTTVDNDEGAAATLMEQALGLGERCPEIIRRVSLGGSGSRLLVRLDIDRAVAGLLRALGTAPPRSDVDWGTVLYVALFLLRIGHPLAGPAIASYLRGGATGFLNLMPDAQTVRDAAVGHEPLPPAELHEQLTTALRELAGARALGDDRAQGAG